MLTFNPSRIPDPGVKRAPDPGSATLVVHPEAEFSDEIQTKVLIRVSSLLPVIHCHLYIFALRILFLQTHATSYSFYSSVTVHCKGDRRKTWLKTWKPYPLPCDLRNLCRNIKSENFQDYAQQPQRNCTFMNSASGLFVGSESWPFLTKKKFQIGPTRSILNCRIHKVPTPLPFLDS